MDRPRVLLPRRRAVAAVAPSAVAAVPLAAPGRRRGGRRAGVARPARRPGAWLLSVLECGDASPGWLVWLADHRGAAGATRRKTERGSIAALQNRQTPRPRRGAGRRARLLADRQGRLRRP